MKRLSREERIGAVMLALVTLIAVGGAALWRHRAADTAGLPPEITVHAVADSAGGTDESEVARKHKSSRKKQGKKQGKGNSRKRKGKAHDPDRCNSASAAGNSGEAGAEPVYRDFLSDTIPTSGK